MRSKVARDALWNLIGLGAPLAAALVAIPPLIRGLGTDRFGVLTLAWVVVGYFSLLDVGLGRALTHVVAATTRGRDETAPASVWPALALLAALGIVGALVVTGLAPILVERVFRIPPELRADAVRCFYALAAAIPFVLVTSGLVGILSAFHRFAAINAIRAPVGALGYLVPLAVLPFSASLAPVAVALASSRMIATVAYFIACWKHLPRLGSTEAPQPEQFRPLLRFGAWMTVSNVISPILSHVDRFVIGATISVAAVAFYATPYEMVTRLLILPVAMMGVLFPAFAESHGHDDARVRRLFGRAMLYVTGALFPVVLLVIVFAHPGLQWWLGPDFAEHGAPVLAWLAVGVFVNSIGQVCFALVQGVGRPDLTAKLHLIELPIYLVTLWFAVRYFGIVGAAIAWTSRMTLDAGVLFWLSSRTLAEPATQRRLGAALVVASVVLTLPIVLR